MESLRGSDPRFDLLLSLARQLDGHADVRAFLEAVCAGDADLLDRLDETVTCVPPAEALRSPLSVLPGQTLGDRFVLTRRIDGGGMGVVFEATDLKVGERRALKFAKAGFSASIPPEARNAMRVTHDNICRIHEIHTADTTDGPVDFISMEYVEGETLAKRWERGVVPQLEAVEIAVQLCKGLQAAHNAGVLHRDLKSHNVMLTRGSERSLRVVITDFGLAHTMAEDQPPFALRGTPNYIAPECWKGSPPTTAADVYALGVILFEMLAGRVPFAFETPWLRRLNEVPDPPSRSPRMPDRRWDNIVLGCLQPDPAKRFGSAGAVLREIEKTFRRSRRMLWLSVAATLVAAGTPVTIFRDRIWPPPLARLAILPVTGSTGDNALDEVIQGSVFEIAGRLQSAGVASRRLAVIPFEESLRYRIDSSTAAAGRLNASHVLSTRITSGQNGADSGGSFAIHATVTRSADGELLREFRSEFQARDVKAFSTSLAGVVTSAFRLDKAPPASVLEAAYRDYSAALASSRRSNDFEPMLSQFLRAAELDPSSQLVLCGIAEAYLRKYRATNEREWLEQASMMAKRAESLNPDSPQVLLLLGQVQRFEGQPERAVELFRRAAEVDPHNSDAWKRTGLAFQAMGRLPDAIASLRKAVQLDPHYYGTHLELGVALFVAGKYSEAVEEFRESVKLAPDLPEAHAHLGSGLLAVESDDEAERSLRKSIALREARAPLNNLAVLLRYKGRDQEAADVLRRALKAGADDPRIRLNLGNALLRVGRAHEAQSHFTRANELAREALRTDPRNATARAQLAYSMVRLGQRRLARDEALQAARLGSSNSILFWVVMTLEAVGSRADGLEFLASASPEQLKDLRRQPDLAGLTRDPRFVDLMHSRSRSDRKF